MLAVSILCTDPAHPVNSWIENWRVQEASRAKIEILRDVSEAGGGDFLFLVSCHQIVSAAVRANYDFSLVLHASELPFGRGMSPHIWQIIEGANRFPLTLLNAEDALDSGDIWQQEWLDFDGTELFDAINAKIFSAEVRLMTWALNNCFKSKPRAQTGVGTMYRRRKPEDSRVDPSKPLADSFDLLRICDPARYPAFFELRGKRYKIHIESAGS